MSYCFNPKCPHPDDPLNVNRETCIHCESELLLQGRYRGIKLLGEGGFAKTFQVDDGGEQKVLKMLLNNRSTAIRLFQREAKVLQQLDCPGIPKVESDGYLIFSPRNSPDEQWDCLVMEMIEGENLQTWLEYNPPPSEEKAIEWLRQLVEILGYFHQQDYIHRDIKPANIMLQPNGKLALVDFGAVREITETYWRDVEGKDVTGIISRGYTPPEQYDGAAVPQSDFFALGRTFVHLLTGKRPSELTKVPETNKLLWREQATQISDWLAALIEDLMASTPAQRPGSVAEIKQYLDRKFAIDWLKLSLVLLVSLVIILRLLGLFEIWELKTFDVMMRSRPAEEMDSRLLIVEVTGEDVKPYDHDLLPDEVLAQGISQLEVHNPRVIALDIFRDRPVDPGHQDLLKQFQNNDNLIAICSIKETNQSDKPGIAPPPSLPEDRFGFSDIVLDRDGFIRRQLLFMHSKETEPCSAIYSLSIRAALKYLAADGIELKNLSDERMQLGEAIFTPLERRTGAYQNLDAAGFQVLLNYRENLARRVSISEVLEGKVNPDWVRDKIILIGRSVPSFSTPYSARQLPYEEFPGVIIQGQMVSQVISAALGERPLLWVWNVWGESLWIFSWSLVGGLIAWRCQQFSYLVIGASAALVILSGVSFGILILGGLVPLLPAALVLVINSLIIYFVKRGNNNNRVYWRNYE